MHPALGLANFLCYLINGLAALLNTATCERVTQDLARVKGMERTLELLLHDHPERDVEDCIARLTEGPVDTQHAAYVIRTREKLEQDLLRVTVYGPI